MKSQAMKYIFVLGAGLIGTAALGIFGSSVAAAYDEAVVTNGGTLSGKVTLKGAVPEPRIFPLALYPFGPYCNKNKAISDGQGNVRISEFNVAADGGMKDVVVAVEEVKRGKPFKPIVANLVARDCEFLPFVSIVQHNGSFVMKNEDPIIHNAQLYQSEKGNLLLTVPNPPNSTGTFPIKFEKHKKIYQMICGMHEFMQTWGYAVDNPYYALTDGDGKFTIDQLPPGTYKVVAWRPHFKPIEREITVSPNRGASLDFEFDSSTVKRPHYETQEKFRIGQ
ncbi:MAG TPA: carboxypeptidase-like regulatory domain-containing protein [Nitrospiria bacterium]|nr:carboxypeptidase-like regulatory domain-containing protein [Nitrospiria bacterium]